MKKNIIIPMGIIAFLITGVYYTIVYRQTSTLHAAKRNELTGDLQQALSLYCATLFAECPSVDLPDINRSKIFSPKLLKREIQKYSIWITSPGKKPKPFIIAAIEGMQRCEGLGRQDNTISELVIRSLTDNHYREEWNKTFFAPKVAIDSSYALLASGYYLRRLSVLVIKSTKNYTYEINLINASTYRGTKCTLVAENSVRLYAPPGEYLLICRSTVNFPSGELWQSHYTPLHLSIPPEPSLLTTELRTSVHRKTKPAVSARD